MRRPFVKSAQVLSLVLLATISGMVAPALAAAKDFYLTQVREKIRTVRQKALRTGHHWVHDAAYRIVRDGTEEHRFTLQQDTTYRFVGVGDSDCRAISLNLYDVDGNLIDTHEDAAMAAVSVTPRWTGPFVLRVEMAHYRARQCATGIGVFATR
jgi:hypothetical protein